MANTTKTTFWIIAILLVTCLLGWGLLSCCKADGVLLILSGSAPEDPPDTDAPTPNPATFSSVPTAISPTAISMTATTGTDATGPVSYYFTCTSGAGHNSGWQEADTTYTDTGLEDANEYGYTITTKDSLGNTGTASSESKATTLAVSTGVNSYSDPNCVLYMRFEPGVLTKDMTGTHSKSDIVESGTYLGWTKEQQREGLSSCVFGSVSDCLTIQDPNWEGPLKVGGAIQGSFCFWYYTTVASQFDYMFSKYSIADNKKTLGVIDNGQQKNITLRFGYNGGASTQSITVPVSLSVSHWYHINFMIDDANTSYRLVVYDDDGDVYDTGPDQTYTNHLAITDTPFCIGSDADLGYEMAGRIDEFIVFDRVLSVAETNEIVNKTFGDAPTYYAGPYFVATDGNDWTGDGSIGSPWLTPQRGVDALVAGDTLYFREGIYYCEGLDLATSGTEGNPITISGYQDEEAILDASNPVTGWVQCESDDDHLTIAGKTNSNYANIYRIDIHQDDDGNHHLYEDGVACIPAMTPTQPLGNDVSVSYFEPIPSETVSSADKIFDNVNFDPNNAEGDWYQYINGLSKAELTTYFGDWDIDIYCGAGKNARVLMHTGVWADPNTVSLDPPFTSWTLDVGDKYSLYHPHALDSAGEFWYSTEPNESGYYTYYLWPRDANDLTSKIRINGGNACVAFSNLSYITLQKFGIQYYGGDAVSVEGASGSSDHINIYQVDVNNTMDRGFDLESVSYGDVNECFVYMAGERGIFFDGGSFNKIRNNTVTDTAGTGISFYSNVNSQITGNKIHAALGTHTNGSSCYLGCDKTLIAKNIYYDRANMVFQDINDLVVFANVMDLKTTQENQLALWTHSDNSGSNYSFGKHIYLHNTLVRSSDDHYSMIQFNANSVYDTFECYWINNLISGWYGSWGSHPAVGGRHHNGWMPLAPTSQTVANGWVMGEGSFEYLPTTFEYENIIVDCNGLDYHLTPDSGEYENPAINSGTSLTTFLSDNDITTWFPDFDFTTDINDVSWSEAPSMGAYEYVP